MSSRSPETFSTGQESSDGCRPLIMEGGYATVAEFGAEGPAARAEDLVRSLLATDRPPMSYDDESPVAKYADLRRP